MLPISLTLKGVYSYLEEQFIDFKDLTAAGLFGIFGQVGAGKSSIIESIIVALYGKNDRLDNSGFWYNMLNLKSNKAYVKFQFEYEQNKYLFEVHWHRNSKKFTDVTHERTAYIWKDDTWQPISNNVQEILGLSYEHFKRTTIIPQGKFKEFLELTPAHRTTMIKEIFELYRFDLKEKIIAKHKSIEAQKLVLDGILQTFQEIDETLVPKLDDDLAKLKEQFDQVNKDLLDVQKQYSAYSILAENWQQREQLQFSLKNLHNSASEIHEKQLKLNVYTSTVQAFESIINKLENEERLLRIVRYEVEQKELVKNQLVAEITDINSKFSVIKTQYELINTDKEILGELDVALKIVEKQSRISHLKNRKLAGKDHIQNKISQRENLLATIQDLKIELSNKSKSELNLEMIQAIDKWYWQVQQISNDITLHKEKQKSFVEQLTQLQAAFHEARLAVNDTSSIDENIINLKSNLNSYIEKEKSINVKLELNHYAASLQPGQPCPLCGAVEHISIQQHAALDKEFEAVQAEISKITAAIQQLEEQKNWSILKSHEYNQLEQINLQHQQQETNLQQQLQELSNNKPHHLCDQYSLANYEIEKNKFLAAEQAYKKLTEAIHQKQNELEVVLQDLKKFDDGIQLIENEIIGLEAERKTLYQSIKHIDGNYYAQQEQEVILKQKAIIQNKIADLELTYNNYNKTIEEKNQLFQQNEGTLHALNQQIVQFELALKETYAAIDQLLITYQYESISAVKQILQQNIDIKGIQNEINDYNNKYYAVTQELNNLNSIIGDQIFSPELLNTYKEEAASKVKHRDELQAQLVQLTQSRDLAQAQWNKYLVHKQQHILISEQLNNAAELKKLFIGDKFIEYISGTYLRQLCTYANVRFHRLTKNQLSLSINDKMEFEIIDYLNSGKSRSVKTLSGGQAFQASLCLALALAESVQAKSKQDQHFFFIDEGFGTQDKDSIPIIFDTLQSISNENRIVGIISHVEELQENIIKYLYISKNEQGSIIEQY